jgi:CBS domain-containing protein
MVQQESRHAIGVRKKDGTIDEAILTVLPVKFADKQGILLTFRDTSEHQSVKKELEELNTRIDFLSKNLQVGIFQLIEIADKRIIEFNPFLKNLLGYPVGTGFKDITLSQVFSDKGEWIRIVREIEEHGHSMVKKVSLKKNDNSRVDVRIKVSSSNNISEGHRCYYGIVEPLLNQPELFEGNPDVSSWLSSLALETAPVSEYCQHPVKCHAEATLRQAIDVMKTNHSSYVLLMLQQKAIGVITARELIARRTNYPEVLELPATSFMAAPVGSVNEQVTIGEALATMESLKQDVLVVNDKLGSITGVLEKDRLFGVYTNPLEIISHRAKTANMQELMRIRADVFQVVKPLLTGPGSVKTITRIVSSLNEKVTLRIIQDAITEMGPPPVPFAFISFGSVGREELVFNSAQDNAIIYADIPGKTNSEVQAYFLDLSSAICSRLDQTGLSLCKGGFMASNPKWCQPIAKWKEYFEEWIVEAEPDNILNFSVLFDLRFVYGEQSLFEELEDYFLELLKGRTQFFYFLAQLIVGAKPPLNVFGNLITETIGHYSDAIDLKKCLAPVTMLARIYALNNQIKHKSTLSRIHALRLLEVWNASTCDEVEFHYNYLMYLRLRQQISEHSRQQEVGNAIVPKKLSEIEQYTLKKVLSQMNGYQEKVSAEFMSAFKG